MINDKQLTVESIRELQQSDLVAKHPMLRTFNNYLLEKAGIQSAFDQSISSSPDSSTGSSL